MAVYAQDSRDWIRETGSTEEQRYGKLRVVSLNIDTNFRLMEEGYARDTHPQWSITERMPYILSTLRKIILIGGADVIHLQEGRALETRDGVLIDSITPIVRLLQDLNFDVDVCPYRPDKWAFSFITAVHRGRFQVTQYKSLYFSKNKDYPTVQHLEEILERDPDFFYGEKSDRCTRMAFFYDRSTGEEFLGFNLHLGMSESSRLMSCHLINAEAATQLSRNTRLHVFVTGDFNSFPDRGGPEQLAIFESPSSALRRLKPNNPLPQAAAASTDANPQPSASPCDKSSQSYPSLDATGEAGPELEESLEIVEQLETLDSPNPTRARANFTFIAFPYDFAANDSRLNMGKALADMAPEIRRQKIWELFDTECVACGGILDHVLYAGFEGAPTSRVQLHLTKTRSMQLSAGSRPRKSKLVRERDVKNFVLAFKDRPAFCTDHQALIATLYFRI